MAAEAAKQRNVITDNAVVPQTGKTIQEWFTILDQKGAKEMDVNGIYTLIGSIDRLNALSEWNRALLTTTYQWDRGLRQRGQKADGFEVSVSKTVAVPTEMLYAAWLDDELRKKWLSEKITITKSTENKSVRALWSDGATRLSVDFYPKAEGKSQIVVQHLKQPDSETAAEMKTFWGESLSDLKGLLEK